MTTVSLTALNAERNACAATQQRARRRRRIFRRMCGTLSFLSFFFMLGVVGSVENDAIALLPSTLYMFGSLGLFALFAWLAGAFK